MLQLVRSGGQTGADIAGLRAAKKCGIPTAGWMPKGFITLAGSCPEYATEFGMLECTSKGYPVRTRLNVRDADATIRIATNFYSAGEKCTLKYIQELGKPFFDVPVRANLDPQILVDWLTEKQVKALNVAGNSERTSPGIEKYAEEFLIQVFTKLKNNR